MWMEGVHFQISRRKGTRCADSVSVFPLATPPFKNVFRFVFSYFVILADKDRSSKHAFLWLRILRDTLIICLSKLSAHTTWKFQISHQLLNALYAFIDRQQQPTNPPNLHISRRAQLHPLIYFVKSQLKISGLKIYDTYIENSQLKIISVIFRKTQFA